MPTPLPDTVQEFASRYPEVWSSFQSLAGACHDRGGPLDDRSRRIAKLGIAIGLRHEGAVHSAVRQALDGGISAEEIMHVAVLSITTLGWPSASAAMTWISDLLAANE